MSRRFLGDRLTRTARPHRILHPAHGPLIGVRRHVTTRKTLGGCLFTGRTVGRALAQRL